ncbi:cyclic nucleotide-gated ion channel 1-like [Pyrus communis]|uniref:cyclic nucleotide-gated ion channel 1-like n=1 Tax=Pyrus communis TaxID=23211 RepID=UPI0035BEC287
MANRREALDVENPAEGFVTGSWNLVTTRALYAPIKGIRDEQGKFLPIWSKIFVMSCVFAVSVDPLFFYILIIDQDKMCLQMDKTLMTIVLVLRILTDIIFAMHFVYKIYVSITVQMHKKLRDNVPANTTKTMASNTLTLVAPSTLRPGALSTLNTETSIQTEGNLDRKSKGSVLIEFGKKIVQKMSRLSFSIINDFLALLPVPQLLIVYTFYNMRGDAYVEHKKVLNVFLLGQYPPRIYRIHQSSKELRNNAGMWVKGLFNFFLYILASHILGAFWYFFSIQRETSCWHSACARHSPDRIGCMNTFSCQRRTTTSRNKTFLEEHCSINATDEGPYDFGIFRDALKNHNLEHIKFGKKFLYSFWWGLRNISNFGTNLSTSTYVWENLFAILISVIGLLLFLYLIGNVQTLMQLEATKSEETRRKIRMKKLDVRKWISENNFPDDVKSEIMNSIDQALKENKDADVDKPFLILPWQTKRSVKRHLFKDTLKAVNKLKDMNEKVLTLMCDYLKPVTYIENNFVFRMGDPLDCMLFIVEGTTWAYTSSDSQAGSRTSSMDIEPLGKGQFYGEELLDWASDTFTKLPVSSKHVKSQTKVEAFVLMAKDLETVVSRYKKYWDSVYSKNREEVALSTFRCFRTKAQQRPSSSPTGIADTNGESLPSTAGK